MKPLFKIEPKSVENGCCLSNEHFPIVFGTKIVIWTRLCWQNFSKVHVAAQMVNFPYQRWTQKFRNCGTFGCGTRTWRLYFITQIYLDYMRNYILCCSNLITFLDKPWLLIQHRMRTKLIFAWSSEWTTILPIHTNHSAFHFQICGLLKQHVLHCSSYWSGI